MHVSRSGCAKWLLEQKRRYSRTNLKVYLCGLLLNGPHDPAIDALAGSSVNLVREPLFVCLATHHDRLADQVPFYTCYMGWSGVQRVTVSAQIQLLRRFADLSMIEICEPIRDVERFLHLLEHCDHVVQLF